MIYANVDGTKKQAEPTLLGNCPLCSLPVRPKCGVIKVWHWAHVSRSNCTYFDHPETPWHREWKLLFPPAWCEVRVSNNRVADVLADNTCIEFQHSPIPFLEVKRRQHVDASLGLRTQWVLDMTRKTYGCVDELPTRTSDWYDRDSHDWQYSSTTYLPFGVTVYPGRGSTEIVAIDRVTKSFENSRCVVLDTRCMLFQLAGGLHKHNNVICKMDRSAFVESYVKQNLEVYRVTKSISLKDTLADIADIERNT